MNRLLAVLMYALMLALSPAAAGEALPEKFDPRRDAAADVATAMTIAKAEGKRVLVDVGGEWCAWCHILDRFFAANEDLRRLRDTNYVWVKVNWSPRNRNEQLLARWPKVQGYPHFFVLEASGELVHSQRSSELESGKDYDRGKLAAFLQRHRRP